MSCSDSHVRHAWCVCVHQLLKCLTPARPCDLTELSGRCGRAERHRARQLRQRGTFHTGKLVARCPSASPARNVPHRQARGTVPVSFANAERSTPASPCELSQLAVSATRLADGRGTAPVRFASAERSTPASVKGTASLRPADGRGTAPLPFASPNLARARGFRQRGTFHTGKSEGHRARPIRQRGTFHTGRCLPLAFSDR
jgi:hypothetical protein